MADQLAIFRTCVVTAAMLALASPLIDLVAPSLVFALSDVPSDTQRPEGWNEIVAAASWLSFLSLVLGAVAAVGLLFLRRWARRLGVAITGAWLLAYLPVGELSYSGMAMACTLASMGVWCVALSMAYFAEPSSHFSNDR